MSFPIPIFTDCEIRETASTQADSTVHNRVTDFVNRTNIQVTVIDRNNIPVILPPAPAGTNMSEPCIEVRVRYNNYNDGLNKVLSTLGAIYNYRGPGCDRDKLRESLDANVTGKRCLNFDTTMLVRKIPLKALVDAQVLYDRNSGFVFCIESLGVTTLHPESEEARGTPAHQEYVKGRPNGILFEIVDNQNLYRQRFTYANNQVVAIPTVLDSERTDGVYVTIVEDRARSESNVETTRLTMAEASEKYGLYATQEEAETSGNPELIVKTRHAELIRQVEMAKTETARMESDFKRQEMELKHQLNTQESANKQRIMELESQANERALEVKQLKDQLEARRAVRDDFYDQRSSAREETKEWLKVVPLILAAFCGGALLARR